MMKIIQLNNVSFRILKTQTNKHYWEIITYCFSDQPSVSIDHCDSMIITVSDVEEIRIRNDVGRILQLSRAYISEEKPMGEYKWGDCLFCKNEAIVSEVQYY